MGRRVEGVHSALLSEVKEGKLFYVYDSFPSLADLEPRDYNQHRDLYANMIKRSRYVTVAPAKIDAPEETQGQIEIGDRYYEAAAAGAVMIGQPPICAAFDDGFPWPDAVVTVRPDGSDIISVLTGLRANPEHPALISRTNASEALRRHDWVHRWRTIYNVAGLAPSPDMLARERGLIDMANLATVPLD
jgi:hypothetical protein